MRIPKKYHHIATDDIVYTDPGGTLFVWLNYGYAYDAQERLHCQGFDTWKEVIESLKNVEVCECPECSKHSKAR